MTDQSEVQDIHIAAIDVGSNAMRLGIAVQDEKRLPQLILRHREPVRLGHDAFTTGVLSEATCQDAIEAFHQFRRILDQHHVTRLRGTATSAMRDSRNGRDLVRRIEEETGIKLDVISGEEEARLVHYSIMHRADLSDKLALLIDIGGGSVEVTLCDDGEIIAAQSFKIGTVRLLEMLGEGDDFQALLSEYLDGARKKLKELIGIRKVDVAIGTGGNVGALGELGVRLFNKSDATELSRKELKEIIRKLESLSFEQRMEELELRPDRADVILPAAMVIYEIMELGKTKCLQIPDASLLDGVMLDMVESESGAMHSSRRNLLAWARSLKKKYHVDQRYAKETSRLALQLFDHTTGRLHSWNNRDRLLLEIAARVHEIGMYVRIGGYHRHAAYLISASPLLGIRDDEKAVMAQIVRYQRKAAPDQDHADYARLSEVDQQKVLQLSAILRLAIALNKERRDRVQCLSIEHDEDVLALQISGAGDLLLERWAALKTDDYFHMAFGCHLKVDII